MRKKGRDCDPGLSNFSYRLLCGIALCTSVFSVVKVFKTTENTEVHRAMPQRIGVLLRSSAFHFQFVTCRSLCRCQTRGQHTERRTGNIVQSCLVAELNRRRFAAMLAADSYF